MLSGSLCPRAGHTPFVEAFEIAQIRDGGGDLAAFLPPPDNSLYQEVLRELVRVDLRYSWERGKGRRLDEYLRTYSQLRHCPEDLQLLAWEEYCLRVQEGETAKPEEYQERFGVDVGGWPPAGALPIRVRPAKKQAAEAVSDHPMSAAALAYRTWRIEHPAAQAAESWVGSFSDDATPIRLFYDLHRDDPRAAEGLAQAMTSMPIAGEEFLGFRLLDELGRGAFGKVYLARQSPLADRFVALKVAGCLFQESQTLAQLQHPHIVPVYSVHRDDPLQAVCMPYLGATTLADVLTELRRRPTLPTSGQFFVEVLDARERRLRGETAACDEDRRFRMALAGRTYVDACLWIGARLAEGLAHAHGRGILHRDLKPANVLLADDGRPLLLDFNLSDDMKLRANVSAAVVGGSLPYMAPEHLAAYQAHRPAVDARSDVYALGLILYELLAGRAPVEIPASSATQAAAWLLEERLRPPPPVRRGNPAVSPAADAIVRHCLEPDVSRRYQSAAELAEDLNRHLEHRPLRYAAETWGRERASKWLRRHPRLAAAAAVALAAAAIVLVLTGLYVGRGQRLLRLDALDALADSRDDLRQAQFYLLSNRTGDPGQAELVCRRLLTRYRLTERLDWRELPQFRALSAEDRTWLRQELGELLLLMASKAVATAPADPALQRKALETALEKNQAAERCFDGGPMPQILWRQRAEYLKLLGRESEASQLPAAPAATNEASPRDLCLRAADCTRRGDHAEARRLLQDATRREPENYRAWYDLGLANEHLGRDADAAACYGTCLALWRPFAPLYYQRGSALLRLKNYAEALADFDAALRLHSDGGEGFAGADLAELYLQRAVACHGLHRLAEAERDLSRALELTACPTRAYFMRALIRQKRGDVDGARDDREAGLRRRPADERSWIARGWARLPTDPRGALTDFDEALRLNPRSLDALQKKAHVLSERLGRPDDSLTVLDRLLNYYPNCVSALGGRGVLLARQGRRADAVRDAVSCLRLDRSPRVVYQVACVYALTARQDSADGKTALALLQEALRGGFGWDMLAKDTDLDAVRGLPQYQRLIAEARDEVARARSPSRVTP